MSNQIAIYGSYLAKIPVKQRYWKRRVDGIIQRYWKTIRRMMNAVMKEGRYEIHGQGKELYKAVRLAHLLVPRKRFVTVSAQRFLENPMKYGQEGMWIEKPTIESL